MLSITRLYILLVLSVLTFMFSCSSNPDIQDKTEDEIKAIAPKANSPVVDNYLKARAELDSSWNTLNKVEEEKIFTLNRLIKEISFNPSHNRSKLKKVKLEVESLQKIQLTQESLSDLKNMDDYDKVSDSVIDLVTTLKEETPNMESYPLADDLITELDSLSFNAVISKRGDYGNAVLKYNEYLLKNEKALKESGIDATPVPGLFEPEM